MTPTDRLEAILTQATASLTERSVKDTANRSRVERVSRSTDNGACVRVRMACLLAKLDRPEIDPRKPYAKEIGTPDSFSGRDGYDTPFLTPFIYSHRLPCNPTTGFLRNPNET